MSARPRRGGSATGAERRVGFRSFPVPPELSAADWKKMFRGATLSEGPEDPACVACRLLLSRALRESAVEVRLAPTRGLLVVVTCLDAGWVGAIRQAWDGWFEGLDGPGRRFLPGSAERWAAFAPDESPSKARRSAQDAAFEEAVLRGERCVGLASDLYWLPADLVLAADWTLGLPALTDADVMAVAVRLCGGTATRNPAMSPMANLVTPGLLRLARRAGQTADDYLSRLAMLVAGRSARVPAAAPSPRAQPTLDRLHGMDEAVEWGRSVKTDLEAFKAGRIGWADVDPGCVLSGPPGCGKSLFARALAKTCGVPLVVGSYGGWHGTGGAAQGDLLKAMAKTFSEARAHGRCIMLIDELDSFPDRATLDHPRGEWMVQVVNQLLSELDGLGSREGVVVIGACNRFDRLDPALVRSGRLERHIEISPPGREALVAILREHLGEDLAGCDLTAVANSARGATGADCERFVRGARRLARGEARTVGLRDLLETVTAGREASGDDLLLVAVHEGGHAVAAAMLRPGAVGSVSMGGSDGAGGDTEVSGWPSSFMRERDVSERLRVLLAGRAAEHLLFGVVSSASGGPSGSDLALATQLAIGAETTYGLGSGGTLAWRGGGPAWPVHHRLSCDPDLAEGVRSRLEAAYADILGLLRPRLVAVAVVAAALIRSGHLEGAEVEAIMLAYPGSGA